MKSMNRAALAAITLALSTSVAFAQTELNWWHSMGGELGERVEALAADFNAGQSEFKVVPSYRGEYEESMISTIAAFRAGEQPHLVQVYEVGTGTMMAAKGAVLPVYELMAAHGSNFDPSAFLPVVTGYYTDTDGNMLSMPFNSSTPILYYNKSVFEKAGLDPNVAPKTWADIESFGQKIVDSGAAKCGTAISYSATWIGTENLSSLHNVPYGSLENGFGGLGTELTFNHDLSVRLWEKLAEWQKAGIYKYGGTGGGSDNAPRFYSGECAIFMGSSASRAGVLANAKDFEVGFGMLPYFDDVDGAPQNSIIGGATLWTLAGHEDAEYKGVAQFLNYLSSAEVQAKFHQETGYLPVTQAAYELTKSQGYYDANPGSDIAIQQINLNPPTENSKGVRFGNMPQIRTVLDEEFQAVLSGSKSAKDALDSAVARGNDILREFEAANQ
jgi:sn-glycerol 3-phosphate transport system substrate-binding protein